MSEPIAGGAQTRADRRGRAARRAGRIMRRVPRVARRREGQAEIGAADREFVRLLLAEQDRAGVAQPHPAFRRPPPARGRDRRCEPAVVRMPRVL